MFYPKKVIEDLAEKGIDPYKGLMQAKVNGKIVYQHPDYKDPDAGKVYDIKQSIQRFLHWLTDKIYF